MINVLKPYCTEEEVDAVAEVIRSGWLGMGPKCSEFESAMEKKFGYAHCITVNSATAALHLALLACKVGPGDSVITPALTFVATAMSGLYCGATPVFADIMRDTLCIDWDDVYNLYDTFRIKAVIPVDFAGYPAGPPTRPDLPIIIQDAAHSCGGDLYGDLVCFSFHPVKPLATGDGGAILTDDYDTSERLRKLRWFGIDKNTWQRSGKSYSWDYDISEVGYKYHWNDIQAAIGLVQLSHLDEYRARRESIARYYTRELFNVVETPAHHNHHVWHLYTIRVDDRDEIIEKLKACGVGTSVHYRPITHYKMFHSAVGRPEELPVTDYEWQRLISLPMHSGLTDDEVEQVVIAVKDAVLHNS